MKTIRALKQFHSPALGAFVFGTVKHGVSDSIAEKLVDAGLAEIVELEVEVKPQPESVKETKPRQRKKRATK